MKKELKTKEENFQAKAIIDDLDEKILQRDKKVDEVKSLIDYKNEQINSLTEELKNPRAEIKKVKA